MAIFDSSGVASGSSTASSGAAVLTYASAALSGAGDMQSAGGLLRLASARFDGAGSLGWNYIQDASASVNGGAVASAGALVALTAMATFEGSSTFQYSIPLVAAGASSMAVVPVVDRHLRPIKAITMGPKTFGWLQLLQRGDLSVFICDGAGPVIPVAIQYRLIQVRLNGSRQALGPQARRPAAGFPGEFYVTGRAGEHGQPGQWIVEWTFQRAWQSTPQVVELPYMVLDAVMAGDGRDVTCRKIKFGWN